MLLFRPQILFVSIDVSQSLPNVLNYFGVSEDDVPTARIVNMETGKKYKIAAEKYTIESMSQLCQEIVDGTAQVNHTCAHKNVCNTCCCRDAVAQSCPYLTTGSVL